ncbi:MAG: pyruvate formate lyase-activating protein [Ruminococcus sp.]|nr:pyruvate formate lyase-activating protein [Ruminococcus sp.]
MSLETLGHIHSTESLGTVDGPGLRFVVFLEGCPMRCAYCHNPDTWDKTAGSVMSVGDIVGQFTEVREFLRGGGITCTGGEPLTQAEFVAELFEEMKRRKVHTCLDTSGITWAQADMRPMIERVLDSTDLVMLDIKHIEPGKHRELTGQDNAAIKDFALHLSGRGIPVWIRHVLVPGVTDDEQSLTDLGRFIAHIRTLKAIDVLPYHTMGVGKYKELGIKYRLEGVPAATKQQAAAARDIIFAGLKQQLREDIAERKRKSVE